MADSNGKTMRASTGSSGVVTNERIDLGPSMQTRARVMVSVAFAVALPALLVAVFRANDAEQQTEVFLDADTLADSARRTQLEIERARTALWRLEAEANVDNRRAMRTALDTLSRSILTLEEVVTDELEKEQLESEMLTWRTSEGDQSLLVPGDPMRNLRQAMGRVRGAVDPILAKPQLKSEGTAFRRANAALTTQMRDLQVLADRARELTAERARIAQNALSWAARDQLVLFLFVFFAMPFIVWLGPRWMIAPLERLRAVVNRLESGKTREIRADGRDEVGLLTRALRVSLDKRDDEGQRKTRKIFEMRKLLREVLSHLEEPVVVIGKGLKIDYANETAGELFAMERHHLEGKPFDEVCFSPQLLEAIERARRGDVEEEGIDVSVESTDGRVYALHVVLGAVQDQDGQVTRVVAVLHR